MVNFREITQNLHKAIVDFQLGSSEEEAVQKIIEDNVPLERATAVSSKVDHPDPFVGPNTHKPMLDLDIPHYYGESTTPGHAHLILGIELPWEKYAKLLLVLEECGILETGYVNVTLSRGQSWMRVPWVKKLPGDKNSTSRAMIEGPSV